MDHIDALEKALSKKANKKSLPLQTGDAPEAYIDVNDLVVKFKYKPPINLEDVINKISNWDFEY